MKTNNNKTIKRERSLLWLDSIDWQSLCSHELSAQSFFWQNSPLCLFSSLMTMLRYGNVWVIVSCMDVN